MRALCHTAIIDSVNLSGGQAGESPIQFVASGSAESVDIVLTFANVTNDASWAADAVLIQPPGQPCYVLGGFDTDSTACRWPLQRGLGSWSTSVSGTYTAQVALDGFNIFGDGLWSINILNGWSGITGAVYGARDPQRVVLSDDDDIIAGCTEPLACTTILARGRRVVLPMGRLPGGLQLQSRRLGRRRELLVPL